MRCRSSVLFVVAVSFFFVGFSLCLFSRRFLSSADALKTGWELKLDAFSKQPMSDIERLSKLAVYEWYVKRLARYPGGEGKEFYDSLIEMHVIRHLSLEALGLPGEASKEWLKARNMFGAEGGEDVLLELKKSILEQREGR